MQNSKIHAMLQEMFKKKGMEVNVCHLEDGFFFFCKVTGSSVSRSRNIALVANEGWSLFLLVGNL